MFGIIARTGLGMKQVVEFADRSTGRGTFGGEFGGTVVTNGDFTAYMSDSAATWPSSQITLGRLVIIIIIIIIIIILLLCNTAAYIAMHQQCTFKHTFVHNEDDVTKKRPFNAVYSPVLRSDVPI